MSHAEEHPWKVLGIPRTTSTQEIKAAYRRCALKFHPDTTTLPRDEASRRFAELQVSYESVIDAKLPGMGGKGGRARNAPRRGSRTGTGHKGADYEWPHVARWRAHEEERARRAGTGWHHAHAPKRTPGSHYVPSLMLFASVTAFVMGLGVHTLRKHYAHTKAASSTSFPLP